MPSNTSTKAQYPCRLKHIMPKSLIKGLSLYVLQPIAMKEYLAGGYVGPRGK